MYSPRLTLKTRKEALLSRRQIEGLNRRRKVLKVDPWLKYYPVGDKKPSCTKVGRDATDEVNAYSRSFREILERNGTERATL